MDKIKVLIADDQHLVRDGIASLLSLEEDIEICGKAENGKEAVTAVMKNNPDVVLMDIRMPVMDGISAMEKIRAQKPDIRILMLTTFDDDEYIMKALRSGAMGYLLKDIPPRELAGAVRMAYKNIYQMAPAVGQRIAESLGGSGFSQEIRPVVPPDNFNLSPREMEVLTLIAEGLTNKEIGERLFVSEGTVKNHVSDILSILGLRDRTQAALFALKSGLVPFRPEKK